jgi:hypothetical protein
MSANLLDNVRLLAKQQEFDTMPYQISKMNKLMWPGFKAAGLVFVINVDVKDKTIMFHLMCDFKLKAYFRYKNIRDFQITTDKNAAYRHTLKENELIPFYYSSYKVFNTKSLLILKYKNKREKFRRLSQNRVNLKIEKTILTYKNNVTYYNLRNVLSKIFEINSKNVLKIKKKKPEVKTSKNNTAKKRVKENRDKRQKPISYKNKII